jgi:antitoxin ParD1/3/4
MTSIEVLMNKCHTFSMANFKGIIMHAQKVTISIPQPLYQFLESYQLEHHCKSRSDVITTALKLLKERQLEAAYREANQELNDDFDHTVGDGLEDETW